MSSMGFAASMLANFGLFLGPYSMVLRFNVRISLPASDLVFLKKPWPVLSPSQLLATTLSSQSGIWNMALASSVGQLSATPLATLTNVSIPTTSAVLKVADLGLPMMGPVKASTSSMLSPNLFMIWKILMMLNTPILLAINAGVSLHNTVVLPKNKSPYSIKKDTIAGSVNGVGIISSKRKYLGGLKKWVPQKCFLKSSDLPSAIK